MRHYARYFAWQKYPSNLNLTTFKVPAPTCAQQYLWTVTALLYISGIPRRAKYERHRLSPPHPSEIPRQVRSLQATSFDPHLCHYFSPTAALANTVETIQRAWHCDNASPEHLRTLCASNPIKQHLNMIDPIDMQILEYIAAASLSIILRWSSTIEGVMFVRLNFRRGNHSNKGSRVMWPANTVRCAANSTWAKSRKVYE